MDEHEYLTRIAAAASSALKTEEVSERDGMLSALAEAETKKRTCDRHGYTLESQRYFVSLLPTAERWLTNDEKLSDDERERITRIIAECERARRFMEQASDESNCPHCGAAIRISRLWRASEPPRVVEFAKPGPPPGRARAPELTERGQLKWSVSER